MKFSNSQSHLSMRRVTEAVMVQMRKALAEELQAAFQVTAAPLHACMPVKKAGLRGAGAIAEAGCKRC